MTKLTKNSPLELIPRDVVAKIIIAEKVAKEATDQRNALRAQILAMMEEKGIVSFETEDQALKITYVPGAEKITLDTKALKKECPDVFDAYARITETSASLRVTVRE